MRLPPLAFTGRERCPPTLLELVMWERERITKTDAAGMKLKGRLHRFNKPPRGVRVAQMNVVIVLTPKTGQGQAILNKLERLTTIPPEINAPGDRTRRYHVTGQDADVDSFDETLDGIDADWRSHLKRYGSN